MNTVMTNSGINIKALPDLPAAFIEYEPQQTETFFTFPFFLGPPPPSKVKLMVGIQRMDEQLINVGSLLRTHKERVDVVMILLLLV
ncbi:hypothetical protein ILYODFUR_026460 [Ilyodon furcidens]|uniref:Uncharacterized protein n=1 Tax=Ilyodon furcidens TaxID=33524 RepID=A0ABV0VHF8_9TELE